MHSGLAKSHRNPSRYQNKDVVSIWDLLVREAARLLNNVVVRLKRFRMDLIHRPLSRLL